MATTPISRAVIQLHHWVRQNVGLNGVTEALIRNDIMGDAVAPVKTGAEPLFDMESPFNTAFFPNPGGLASAVGVPRHASNHAPLTQYKMKS